MQENKAPNLEYLVEKKLDLKDQVAKNDPSKYLVEGQDSKEIKDRKLTYFVIVTMDSEGLQGYQRDDKIQVDILTSEGDQLKTVI